MEQINSYFSRLGNTTKYMLPEGECTVNSSFEMCFYYHTVNEFYHDVFFISAGSKAIYL